VPRSPQLTAAFAAEVVRAVRAVATREVLPRYRNVDATLKPDGSVVTEADIASQEALVGMLRAIEDVAVIGEEMHAREQQAVFDAGGRFWCVDPLDGTSNFSRGVPFFAISVALMEDARPIFGVVLDPVRDEAFHAVRGGGAWWNDARLELPQAAPALADAIAEVSLRRETKALRPALKTRKPYRRRLTSGSSALSWCHLAAARIDVMLHSGQKMWDYAAGALILEEAGGCASTLENDDFWSGPVWRRSVLAARSRPLLEEWKDWVRREHQSAANETDQKR
jgi:myo-inositol-1(or 4)-monophosphatase